MLPQQYGPAILGPRPSRNICTNGGFETNTTGWLTFGTNTIARSTARAFSGAASLLCTAGDNTALAAFAITLTAVAHMLHAEVWLPTDYDGTSPALRMNSLTSVSGSVQTALDLSKRDQWQHVIVGPFTPDAGDVAGDIILVENGTLATAGRTANLDEVQVEPGSSATPYIHTDGAARSRRRLMLV